LQINAIVPPNAQGVVYLPAETAGAVTESGRPLSQVDGIHAISQVGGELCIELGSGEYRFNVSADKNQSRPGI
jgi:alpha-L-rhamnosidase